MYLVVTYTTNNERIGNRYTDRAAAYRALRDSIVQHYIGDDIHELADIIWQTINSERYQSEQCYATLPGNVEILLARGA